MRRHSAHQVAVTLLSLFLLAPSPVGSGLLPLDAAASAGWSEADLWLTPAPVSTPGLATAVKALADGDREFALRAFTRAANDPLVGGYARLYQGRTELALDRADAAASSARHVMATAATLALREEALWLLASALEKAEKWSEAATVLTSLTELPSRNLPAAYLRLGRAAFQADEPVKAEQSFTTLIYDFSLTAEAREAEAAMRRQFHWPPATHTFERADRRAESLFAGRQFEAARKAFEEISAAAPEPSRQRIRLRLAQCDVQLGRYGQGREALRAYLDTATERLDEAGYAYLTATRGLHRDAEYIPLVRTFAAAHPASVLAEAALNDLATYHILADDDDAAAAVFREMLQRYPRGAFAERAVWKAGWAAFRKADYGAAIAFFEPAAVDFPRSDYRPSWLYWAARAHERLGHPVLAAAGYRATVSSYRNSYYGRQAANALAGIPAKQAAMSRGSGPEVATAVGQTWSPAQSPLSIQVSPAPPSAPLIRALLAAELYDDAILELRRTQVESGASPLLDATLAYAMNRKGDLRPAITAMRRAYPQFIAEGGEALPSGLLRVIFPLDYWDLIRHYAGERGLDPYLMAALIAQESTFQADIRSHANAWGLMQILPTTGRRLAPTVGVRSFTTRKLTDPDVNLRIGMKYFQDLIARFGGDIAPALAAYNAGESRVVRWLVEHPGVDRDEFIDDIPFPETQNYVKRILGTAEDYRMLYGSAGGSVVRRSSR